MAENLDDGEFWLPSQFLADDDIPFEKNATGFGSYLVPSDLGSPVESLVGSSETESDEEDHMAELTRLMTHSTLQLDNLQHAFKASEKYKGMFVPGSPQSTLCAFGSGCGCRKGSIHGSPNSACRITSQRATGDLLHAAAGEVERMRLSEEGGCGFNHHRGLLGPPRKPTSMTLQPVNNTNSGVGFFTQHALSHHQQLQIAQFQMLRQQQMATQQKNSVWGVQTKPSSGPYEGRQGNNQMVPNRGRNIDVGGGRNVGPLGLSPSAWPALQQTQPHQQYGSGMRAVFLGNPDGKRECSGTGVFLPRRVDSPAESRRKPACSTVLVPARVAQALNLNLDDMENAPTVAIPRLRSNYGLNQHKRNVRLQPPVNHEIRLPQEWTY